MLFFLQEGAVLYGVFESFAVGARHVTTVVSRHLHGNAATGDRLRVGKTRKVADLHSVYPVPDAVQPKVSPLVAGGQYPLVFNRGGHVK